MRDDGSYLSVLVVDEELAFVHGNLPFVEGNGCGMAVHRGIVPLFGVVLDAEVVVVDGVTGGYPGA